MEKASQYSSRLTLVEVAAGKLENGTVLNLYRCACGSYKLLPPGVVERGKAKSCGCLRREHLARAGDRTRTHGLSSTIFYKRYTGMMTRCYNLKSKGYENYGGRGITVCERWHTFENFRDDMYESYLEHRKAHHGKWQTSLERINNNLGYSPDNCKWATPVEQSSNKRTPSINSQARLTPKQVVNILHCQGSVSSVKLGLLYGVSSTTILNVWNRKYWRNLPTTPEYYL